VIQPSGGPLVGRAADLQRLAALLAQLRAGSGAALVLSGDVGLGKSRLLQELVKSAGDLRPLVVTGYEGEIGFPFAALHRLVRPLLEALPQLSPRNGTRSRSRSASRSALSRIGSSSVWPRTTHPADGSQAAG
jgi:predicted ATPase